MEIWNRSFIFEIAQDQTCRHTKAMVARVALVFFGVPCHRRVGSPTVTSSLVDFSCAWPTIAQLWGPEVGRFLLCGDGDGLQGASSRVCAVFCVVLSFVQWGTRLDCLNFEMSHTCVLLLLRLFDNGTALLLCGSRGTTLCNAQLISFQWIRL